LCVACCCVKREENDKSQQNNRPEQPLMAPGCRVLYLNNQQLLVIAIH
jgi:hypothetical protein